MTNEFLIRITRLFDLSLPHLDSLDQYLDFVIPKVAYMGENIGETEYYFEKRWMEIRDSDNFHEAILHIFKPDGLYMQSIDGNVSRGKWSHPTHSNSIMIEHNGMSELYDLAFLDDNFFILKKHGDQVRKGKRKYFVMGLESRVKRLEWKDTIEMMYNVYRANRRFVTWGVICFIIVFAVIAFSLF